MNTIVQFLLKHGYSFLFGAMFAHQIGFPVPGPLFLLAAGALAASGKLGVVPALGVAISACVLADWIWYEAGRRRGDKVLHFIHRLTRDPDAHDRRAKRTFALYGPPILIVAKFIPGLDAVAPPLAGTSGTSRLRFLAFETLGVSLYACVYFGLGHMFSHDLDHAAQCVGKAGKILAGLFLAAIFIYGICKLIRRHRSSQWRASCADYTSGFNRARENSSFTKRVCGACCGAVAPADYRESKRQRRSINDQEFCITHNYVRDARI